MTKALNEVDEFSYENIHRAVKQSIADQAKLTKKVRAMKSPSIDNPDPQSEVIEKQIDEIVFRCFAQGQYWGTGSGESDKLNPDYEPENPIDRTEAVKSLLKLIAEARIDELNMMDYSYHTIFEMPFPHNVNQMFRHIRSRIQKLSSTNSEANKEAE